MEIGIQPMTGREDQRNFSISMIMLTFIIVRILIR